MSILKELSVKTCAELDSIIGHRWLCLYIDLLCLSRYDYMFEFFVVFSHQVFWLHLVMPFTPNMSQQNISTLTLMD